MSRPSDPSRLLVRALAASAEAAGCPVEVLSCTASRWASATFVGARHQLTLAAPPSARLDLWLPSLPEADLPLRHHLVADLVVMGVERSALQATITLEALTVEER
jgi:hypothetical protein